MTYAEKVCGKSGGLVRESPQNPLNSGLGIIVICPESPCQMMIGVYNHLRNERYLGSMKPFSVSVSQDP